MYYPSIFNDSFCNDLFDEVVNFPFDYGKRIRNEVLDKKRCTTDIKEFDDRYEIDMEFPGFDKKDIKAELKNGYLVVSAEHTEKKDEGSGETAETADAAEGDETEAAKAEAPKSGKYICRERYYGKYERSFFVGKNMNKEDIKAEYLNGVLTLQVPKVAPSIEKDGDIISID